MRGGQISKVGIKKRKRRQRKNEDGEDTKHSMNGWLEERKEIIIITTLFI